MASETDRGRDDVGHGGERLLPGNPDSREVQRRSVDEGIGKAPISAKIRNALAFFRAGAAPAPALRGVDA